MHGVDRHAQARCSFTVQTHTAELQISPLPNTHTPQHPVPSEEVRHDVMFKYVMHLACTITHAYKYSLTFLRQNSWLLKPRYFSGGLEGLSRLKGLLFEDEYRGAEDRAKLQGYIGEPLARSTVDALNEGRKYCLPIYNSH